ncbi:hypothetical protein LJPFL01_3380 [Lelliottia jeotgali]|nr:hypothetical protein LJPFL01_3380 [Lelliottia jeotgali]
MNIKSLFSLFILLSSPLATFAANTEELSQKLDEGYRYACNATQTGEAASASYQLENYRMLFTGTQAVVGFSQIMHDEIDSIVAGFFKKGMIQGNTSTAACETPQDLLATTTRAVYTRQVKLTLASNFDDVRFSQYATEAYPIFDSIIAAKISEEEANSSINKIANNAIINNEDAVAVSNATNAMKAVAEVLVSVRNDKELEQFLSDYIRKHK